METIGGYVYKFKCNRRNMKNYKPGQLVTINGNVYRLKKVQNPTEDCEAIVKDCRTARRLGYCKVGNNRRLACSLAAYLEGMAMCFKRVIMHSIE